MFNHFLNDSRLELWSKEIENFPILTENFTPKDLKHVVAKIQLKSNLGKNNPGGPLMSKIVLFDLDHILFETKTFKIQEKICSTGPVASWPPNALGMIPNGHLKWGVG